MTSIPYVVDDRTGIAIVQPASSMPRIAIQGVGLLTYRCHSCGDLIPKHWEAFFADPVTGWASYVVPAEMPRTMTTHHDWHMAADGD